jgi:hypothetical protein
VSLAERQDAAAQSFAVARRGEAQTRRKPVRSSRYTKQEIIGLLRQWAERYGDPPIMLDWEPTRARKEGQEWRADRFESGAWPTAKIVLGQFGLFSAAVEQAGLEPRRSPSRSAANLVGPEAILHALVQWTRRYGDVPTMADWDPHRARVIGQYWRIARYQQDDWPSVRTVAHHFGSLRSAIVAAGLLPRERGKHHVDRGQEQAVNRLRAAEHTANARRPGLADFAESLRALAAARSRRDPVSTHAALIDVAASALAWAQICGPEL